MRKLNKKNNEIVSISIVTYNSQDDIKNCIEGIKKQTYKKIEIIIVDNASTDKTIEIIEGIKSDFKFIKSEKNTGYCGGNNIAIDNATGDFILCLNPDVSLSPDYIQNAVNVMKSNEELGGCIGKILQMIDGEKTTILDTTGLKILKNRRLVARGHGDTDIGQYDTITEIFGVDGMAALYRRCMIEDIKINGEFFDESYFAYCEDQDVSWRAQLLGWKFKFVPKAIGYHIRKWKHSSKHNIKSLFYRKKLSRNIKRMAIRNHYCSIIKNDFPILLIRHIIPISWRFFLILGFGLIFERNTTLGLLDVIKCMPQMIKKRCLVMVNKRVDRKYMSLWYV